MKMTPYLLKSTITGALGGLLFGFDTAVIAGATQQLTVVYHLTSFTLGLTVAIGLVGTVVGAMSAGVVGQRIGGREALRIMAILYTISALGCALSWNWPALMVFRFIGGLGVGGSSVLGPVYIAELAPAKWRGRLVGMFQINIVIGILLAYLSNYLISLLHLGALQWRWQLGVAAIPSLLFLIMLYGIPRSSRWLVTKNRTDEALDVLKMMGSPDSEAELREIMDSIWNVAWPRSRCLSATTAYPSFSPSRLECSISSPESMPFFTIRTTSSRPPASVNYQEICKRFLSAQ
jgi:MFS family permease